MPMTNGRNVLLEVLRSERVTHCFGNPGTSELFVECTGAIIDYDNRPARLEIMRDVTGTRRLRRQRV